MFTITESDKWRRLSMDHALFLKKTELTVREKESPNDLDALRETEDRANMLAEQLIASAGFDLQDSDSRGSDMGNTVRDTLVFVILRLGVDAVEEGWL